MFRLLINADRSEIKVSIGEAAGVVINHIGATAGTPGRAEGPLRPFTTKRQVDDNVVVTKV